MEQDLRALIEQNLGAIGAERVCSAPSAGLLVPGERRNVAVVFLDLKDFTGLSESLDHEVVHELVNTVMRSLSGVVEHFGGYVDKIEGDRIMALFGATGSVENECVRAVSCSLGMLRALQELNSVLSTRGAGFGYRAGICWGPATVAPDAVGHLTATGDTVNVASRMENIAETDTILVCEAVRRQCGERFEWSDLGSAEVKGKREPIRVFRPVGPGREQRARWERAARVARSALVGRAEEMDLLRAKLEQLDPAKALPNARGTGARHVFVGVAGEAGAGKSRLVHEFVSGAGGAEETVVLRGYCRAYAQKPYQLWSSLLLDLLSSLRDERGVRSCLEGLADGAGERSRARALVDSLPFLEWLASGTETAEISGLDEKTRHAETVMAVRNLIRVIGERGRTLVFLDDLHWIDESSLEALRFTLENCDTRLPLMFVATYRPEWTREGSPLSRVGPGYAEVTETRLEPISLPECRRIADNILRGPVSEKVRDIVPERCGGNPLFLEELILDLIESGGLVETGSGWELREDSSLEGIPSSVGALVRSRMDRLPPGERQALQFCSVLGLELGAGLARELWRRLDRPQGCEALLDSLSGKGFLERAGREGEMEYRFRHALVRDSAYETLLLHNRRVLHARAAEAIEAMNPGELTTLAPVIAHHWLRAGDEERTARWGIRAAETLKNAYSNEEALGWVDRVLTISGDNPALLSEDEILDAEFLRQSVLFLMGPHRKEEECLNRLRERAKASGNTGALAEVSYRFANHYLRTGRFERAIEAGKEALSHADESGERIVRCRAMNTLGVAYALTGKREEARDVQDSALELARELGDEATECSVLGNLGSPVLRLVEPEEAVRSCTRALELARRIRDKRSEGMALTNVASLKLEAGDLDRAEELFREALAIHREIGNRHSEGVVLANMGVLFRKKDRPDLAAGRYREAIRLSEETGNVRNQCMILANLGNACAELDRMEEADTHYSQARALAEKVGGADFVLMIESNMADSLREQGRTPLLIDSLRRIIGLAGEISDSATLVSSLAELGALLWSEGEREEAKSLYLEAVGVAEGEHSGEVDLSGLRKLHGSLVERYPDLPEPPRSGADTPGSS